jgi:hypothetical protein
MAAHERASGVVVHLDEGVTLARTVPAARGAAAKAASGGGGRLLLEALQAQDLSAVDAIDLRVAPAPAGRARSAATAGGREVRVEVPLAAQEHAVVLVERDGVFSWRMPQAPRAARRSRGGGPDAVTMSASRRVAVFRIDLGPAPSRPRGKAPSAARGLRPGVPVVVHVLRFLAAPLVRGAVRFLERNVTEGLVHLTGVELERWMPLAPGAAPALPRDRPARLLLLVHGTFSATVGSFGALAAQPEGREFLAAALRHYDAVLGWDHRTLGVTPLDNAIDLAARLEQLGLASAPEIDAIAFSRGGLVLRSLFEQVMPGSALRARLGRAVFVACTHGGTQLANPANWRARAWPPWCPAPLPPR